MAQKTVTIKDGQSVFDLALLYYGTSSKAVELCRLNPDVLPDVMAGNLAGKTIVYEETINDVTNYYKKNNITIATVYPEVTGSEGFSDEFTDSFA